jgi:hypothetical protein
MTTLQLTRHAALQPHHNRPDYRATARMWRAIAHTAQLDGDLEAVRQAHFRALENEQFAKQNNQTKGTK